MSNNSFAIVCDSTCGLEPELLARLGVVCVPLGVSVGKESWLDGDDDFAASAAVIASKGKALATLPTAQGFIDVYRRLAESGYTRIVTACNSFEYTGVWRAVEEAVASFAGEDVQMRTVDAGASSVALGMVAERLAWAREKGMEFEDAVELARELARKVRLLFIPAAYAPFEKRALYRKGRGLMTRATSLRLRIAGERVLYLQSHGEYTALARATDLDSLCRRAARALESVTSKEGELVCARVDGGDQKSVRALSDALDAAEVEFTSLGRGYLSPSLLANVGSTMVGVAFAPKSVYLQAGAQSFLPSEIL